MFFKPRKNKNLWDTFVYFHDGTFYLYYLVSDPSNLYGICLATSKDGALWDEHGMILHRSDDARWMAMGSIVKSPSFEQDHIFRMNISEWRGPKDDEGQQTIFAMESTDLIHWTFLGKQHEFVPDPRWYRANQGNRSRWDGINAVPRPGGGYYAFLTANPKDFHPGFGFGESEDGIDWRALPPPRFNWDNRAPMNNIEVGGVEKFNDKYYMMVGTWGLEKYEGHGGMLTFSSKNLEGPYQPEKGNFHLLTSTEHLHSYFSRFCPTPHGILVNYQLIPRHEDCYFAPFKRAIVDSKGVLRLAYWEGNERLKGNQLNASGVHGPDEHRVQIGDWGIVGSGLILEGSFHFLPGKPDIPAELTIECNGDASTCIKVHRTGLVEFGPIPHKDDKPASSPWSRVDREMPQDDSPSFRLWIDKCTMEFYLNDYLIQAYSLHGNATGRVFSTSVAEAGRISGLKVWRGREQPRPNSSIEK
jgi:hypothetical protein